MIHPINGCKTMVFNSFLNVLICFDHPSRSRCSTHGERRRRQHEDLVTALEKGKMDLADLAYKARWD